MATRLRSTEASLMAREKLASLGTLAAGLAHELNNPAAAIRRATSQLREATRSWRRWSARLTRLNLDDAQSARLRTLELETPGRDEDPLDGNGDDGSPTPPSPLEAAEAEERLTGWLGEHGVDRPSSAAAALAARGWTLEEVEPLAADLDDEPLRVALSWLAASAEVSVLQEEIETSAAAISDIVRATRSYTYLDQAPVQDVSLEDTLEATLTILRHEWKHGVDIVREYGDVAPIEAFGSELTQVWTNLIENAIDAMEGRGTLELRTYPDPGDPGLVVVEVADSGPGIPDETRNRIFEPFFTTKPPGKGSGLGLHIAYDIVVNHHGGSIEVDSRPGRTTFVVRLPRRLQRETS
jgi:signal transduction histidine kinase